MKLKRADGSEVETTPYMTIPGAGRLDLSKFHMVYEPPQPDNVVRNADGTPYQAGYDAGLRLPVPHGMKRFTLRSGSEVAEGVVFSDDMAVVYGKSIQAFLSEQELIGLFPGAAIEWIDKE